LAEYELELNISVQLCWCH